MCLLFTLSVTYNHTSPLQICDLNVTNYSVSIVIHVYKLINPFWLVSVIFFNFIMPLQAYSSIPPIKGAGLGYGRTLYFHCLLKYMVICAFENPLQFQTSWQHILFTLDMDNLKKNTPCSFTFP